MTIKESIKNRSEIRKEIEEKFKAKADFLFIRPLLLIGESLDDFIEHRITADKVQEGILKDIQNSIESIAQTRIEKLN